MVMSGERDFYFVTNAFSVSNSVGSGKTHAAIRYMLENPLENFLYVAPTVRLVEQTATELKESIQSDPDTTRNVHLIHSYQDLETSSFETALAAINTTSPRVGAVVVITTTTFLEIIAMIRSKPDWHVILDEAFKPLEFSYFQLGKTPELREANQQYFNELFHVDEHLNRVRPAEGKAELVRAVSRGDLSYAGSMYQGMRRVAKAVSNPALRCELVDGGQAWKTLASYVTPEHFETFGEVVFMAALFEQSILYHLWSKHWDIHFQPHPQLSRHISRDVHKEQGPFISIAHVLHGDDPASRYNLEKDPKTGKANAAQGRRVIDRAIEIAGETFEGHEFLLQANNWTNLDRRKDLQPVGAKVIPVNSHGLNLYKGYTRVASLAVTNPDKHEAKWIMERTGLEAGEMYLAYRIHTVYQSVGRSAIRDYGNTKPKVFLVAGREDALFLHRLFKGSRWLGQVGDLPSLQDLKEKRKKEHRGRRRVVDLPGYQTLRNRKDSLQKKRKKGTLGPAERLELVEIQNKMMSMKSIS